jgi:poly(ADP-ribose) glycohydrolase ARH3
VDGAAVLAWAIAQAVQLDAREPFPFEDFVQGLADFARTPEIQNKIALIRTLIAEDVPPLDAARYLGRTVAMHESLPFALYAFLCHPRSFEQCLFCAILNGGDRDTLGAMACAVSGAYLGVEAIPQAWREKLENRKYIESLAIKLVDMRE